MFNIFQQPWALIFVAAVIAAGVFVFHCIWPDKSRLWHSLIAALIVVLAFGIDFFVKTDLEKINSVIGASLTAVEDENAEAIARILAEDYWDSAHNSKQQIMAYFKSQFAEPFIRKATRMNLEIDLKAPQATATLIMLVKFDEKSSVYQYKPFLFIKARLSLDKQADKQWLISRVELLEIDRQPSSWRKVR